MPPKISSGLLMYRANQGNVEVLLAHYGGPLWARKDFGSWTVVKGEVEPPSVIVSDREGAWRSQTAFTDEELLQNAQREFCEETGIDISGVVEFTPLGEIKQRGGKIVHAWAFEAKVNKDVIPSASSGQALVLPKSISTFEMEWPPHSGQIQKFPEIDRAEWFLLDLARQKINPAQVPFLDRLLERLSPPSSSQT